MEQTSTPNPPKTSKRLLPDQSSALACLSAGFRLDRVPVALDAVVIGSGIGGLTTAALLSKAGKRVLVLEQHDTAGGCTHTFQKKGFEFDVGKCGSEENHQPSSRNLWVAQSFQTTALLIDYTISQSGRIPAQQPTRGWM